MKSMYELIREELQMPDVGRKRNRTIALKVERRLAPEDRESLVVRALTDLVAQERRELEDLARSGRTIPCSEASGTISAEFEEEIQKGRERLSRMAEEESRTREERWRKTFQEGHERYFRAVKEEVLLEITEELLCSTFSLPDGTVRTWGEATAEEHGLRAESLKQMAGSTIVTAARHAKAADLIKQHGVSNLQSCNH